MRQPIPRIFTAIIMAILPLMSGCVFINTFYNARIAYDRARAEHQKLLRQNPDSAIILPSNIQADYDTAISKSLKVLDLYHTKAQWQDDALFMIGRASFYKGDYEAARRRLRQLVQEQPQSVFVPEAYLYIGKSYLADENFNQAEETFIMIIERYPQLNKNEEISLLIAQISVRREGKAMAIEILEKARSRIKDGATLMQLHAQIAELYMQLKQYQKAAALLKSAPQIRSYPELLYRIESNLAVCLLDQNKLDEALELTNRLLHDKLFSRHIADLLVNKGDILDLAGKIDAAIAAYDDVVKNHENSPRVGEALYKQAAIYQKKKNDYAKAKEYYTKALAKLTDPEMKKTAQMRLDALAELGRIKPSADSTATARDTSKAWDSLYYTRAEIFWLRLDQPDSALTYYTAIARDTAKNRDSVPKALYAAGWILRNAMLDTSASDSLFALVLSRYPASVYAKASQEAQGAKVTVLTREDSAGAAFVQAENLLLNDENAAAAIDAYLKVSQEYRDQSWGAKALYAAAWLNDQILEKKKTALNLYQMLCDSFPKSDYCRKEAQPRIRIVQDTLKARSAARNAQPPSRLDTKVSEKMPEPSPAELNDSQVIARPAPIAADSGKPRAASADSFTYRNRGPSNYPRGEYPGAVPAPQPPPMPRATMTDEEDSVAAPAADSGKEYRTSH
jgi:tetratricopeptide (TPR) repeat protein